MVAVPSSLETWVTNGPKMLRRVTEHFVLSTSAEITQNLKLCLYYYACPSVCDLMLVTKLPHLVKCSPAAAPDGCPVLFIAWLYTGMN
jgi:hypothetical protein